MKLIKRLNSKLGHLKNNKRKKKYTSLHDQVSLAYNYNQGINWIKNNFNLSEGVIISSKKRVSYPEVTGYFIPTLYQWGERELARNSIKWLIQIQNPDGSFSAPDGTPYTFDTGQVIRGFVASLNDLPEVEKSLRKACDWILTQIQSDGRLSTPSTEMWGDIADDRIHLYVLAPLIEVGERLREPEYVKSAYKILNYYRNQKDIVKFNTLSHFYAYIIEALCDLGERKLAEEAMKQVADLQNEDGSVPAYNNVSWICSTGIAQFAVIWYKLGMTYNADKALHYLEKVQNETGGFFGSYGKSGNYFADEEISWAVKFFLDAYYWKIRCSFNQESVIFSDTINENDGRVQTMLNSIDDLNSKKAIDVGCGKGRFLRIFKSKFPKASLYGLDISDEMLKFCPKGVETKNGTILDIPYPDAYFDFVYSVETLEHSLRPESAINEMARILKSGGKIIIIDKNIAQLGKLQLEPWEQWFEPEEIVTLLYESKVDAHYELITYNQKIHPDGLFIAWKGVKL